MNKGGFGRGLAVRWPMYFVVWIIVDQSMKPANLGVGALAGFLAAWVSLKLLPRARGGVHLGQLTLMLPRFLWQSLTAGFDVARCAFARRPDLRPGFIEYPTELTPGSARNAFELIASLMPGSLASDEGPRTIEFHVLDLRQPVREQLAAEERAYGKALLVPNNSK
jgi:multicomponent Na+:H+ antiporter subunit E